MKWLRQSRPSPALVISLLALFIALGGTGYAAFKLPKNSVGTKQLKKNAVVSSKVKNHSLRAVDFKAGQLPAGPQGPQGPKGDPGPSTAFSAADQTLLAATGTDTVVTLNLPAGSYALFAKVLADNNNATSREDVSCELDAGATVVDPGNTIIRLDPESSSSGDRAFYVLTGTTTLATATPVTVKCTTSDPADIHYFRRAITAVQVGALG